MVKSKYVEFIQKLIIMTKEDKIEWKYLDSNSQLCQHMNWMEGDSGFAAITGVLSGKIERTFDFDREKSFYCSVEQNYIVLYVSDGNPATMFVIPSSTYKKIVTLSPDDYGEYITRLLNLVESKFPSADAFIDNFLING